MHFSPRPFQIDLLFLGPDRPRISIIRKKRKISKLLYNWNFSPIINVRSILRNMVTGSDFAWPSVMVKQGSTVVKGRSIVKCS